MRNTLMVSLVLLAAGVALSVAFAQSAQNRTGWPFGGPTGTFYKGAGTQTIIGKPTRLLEGEEDQGGYHILPAPDSDKRKPYERRAMSGVWELNAASNVAETVSSWVPPMTAKGKAMFAQTRPGVGPRAVGRDQNDGDNVCDPLGWPRVLYKTIRPVEFITLSNRVLQHWAWRDQWRTIWTDGRRLPTDPDPLWYGYSVGRWETDSNFHEFTTGEDDRMWIDRLGSPHSLNMLVDALWHRLDHNTLELNITVNDPEIYTQPWVGNTNVFHLLTQLEIDPLPCSGSEEIFFRDQMRNFYPKDEDIHREIKEAAPTVVAPPVRLPNTGVGLSK
jgi:hypothetical protein